MNNLKLLKSILKNNLLLAFFLSLFFVSCSVCKPVKNQGEPRLTGYHFTNKDGKKITGSVTRAQEYIYLVVLSENAIGEKVTIAMDEKTETDYIYNGAYVSEKLRFQICNNEQKLKLEIYNSDNKRHRRLKEKAMKNKTNEN